MSRVPAIVRTRSLRGGHFRAGLKHGAKPGDIPPGTVTEDQLAQLRADPDLDVQVLDAPPRKKKPAASETPEAGPAEGETAEDDDFAFDDGDPDPEAKGK